MVQDRSERGHTLVVPRGEIDVHTANALRERITQLVEDGHRHLGVDLRSVTYMDSSCLGVLLAGLKLVRLRGGTLELVVDQPRFLRIFDVTGLDTVFTIHAGLDELVGRAGRSAEVPVAAAVSRSGVPAQRAAG